MINMKRSASALTAPKRSSLQQPVSCQFCRTRKLKCDREHPCFNCSSRDITCLYGSESLGYPPRPSRQASSDEHEVQDTCERDHAGLTRRIQRLEAAVFPTEIPELPSSRHVPPSRVIDSRPRRNQDEEQQQTSQWLEGFLTDPHAQDIPKPLPIENLQPQETHKQISAVDVSAILSQFPTEGVGEVLIHHYIKTVDATYRILHVPTTWRWFRDLYADLHGNRTPSATRLAFFLGIFAGSAHVSKPELQPGSLTMGGQSPLAFAEVWFQHAVSLLTKPPVSASTEALQTFTSLTHLCTQIEGFAGSFNILTMSSLRMAKSMKVHRLDTPRYREERRKNGADMVDIEIKRRMWWHLVSSDWLLSTVGGPHEGTYLLNPRQMETNPPSNVEDDDIPTGITGVSEESYNLPLSTPTSMTYFLCRIQAATLSREVIDHLPPSFFASPGADTSDEIYNIILVLDRKYQQFLKSLPPFYHLTIRGHDSYNALIKDKPYLEWQRYLINFVIHTQLARLHRAFLIRGSTEPKFAYSRMQCIRSAETVLEIWSSTMGDRVIGSFTYVLAHFLMAAIILAMDVCFNPDEMRVAQRKQDVLLACRRMEEELKAKLALYRGMAQGSQLTTKSLQKVVYNLRGILRRNMSRDRQQSGTAVDYDNPITETSARTRKVVSEKSQRFTSHCPAGNSDSTPIHATQSIEQERRSAISMEETPSTHSEDNQISGKEISTPFPPPPSYDAHTRSDSPSEYATGQGQGEGEQPTLDELWDEFFSVGPNFDGSDWDTFLVDLDLQVAGMGTT